MTDDIDGVKADQTVRFTFDGHNYEIDLSKKNANAFNKALKPSARKVHAARTRAGATRRSAQQLNLPVIRAWAKSHGYEISDRGRIPQP